jgi:TonB-linked SusC/RagA family outer membrane protein
MKNKMKSFKGYKPNKAMILLFSIFMLLQTNVFAQTIETYKAIVLDETGEGLPGVTVKRLGTDKGTVTDIDGKFTIDALAGENLEISFVGYETQLIRLTENKDLKIQLALSTTDLDEVVVIGYGTLDKKELTSAISHISAEDLSKTTNSNPLMAIQGKVAGLTITNTGGSDPNSEPSIQIRGASSRLASNDPLYVIDGIPGGSLQNINPDDIKSIDVLKDGAASAIYGTRGGAGVIVITTKKGKAGKTQSTYSSSLTIDIPKYELETLSADEFLDKGRGTDYGSKTDWKEEVTRDYSIAQKHSLSFSGGAENFAYRVSADYKDAEGLDLRSAREEYGARISVNHKTESKLFESNFNIAPRVIKKNNSHYDAVSKSVMINPTYSVKNPMNPELYTEIPSGSDGFFNPVELLEQEESGTEGKLLDWNGSLKLNILKNLNTEVTVSQNMSSYFDYYFLPSTTSLAKRENRAGKASRKESKWDEKNFSWVTNYMLEFNKNLFKFMGGYSYQETVSEGLNGDNADFTSDALKYNNLGDGTYNSDEEGRLGFGSYKEDSRLVAFFGRVNYNFDNKYVLSASLRKEGSTRFGNDEKWGYFPAVSAGWRITQESFMKNIKWLNELKLRADYGVTGNQNFGNYNSLSIYQGYGNYLYDGKYYKVWGPGNNTNKDLKWEVGKNFNLGIDFSLLNNRVRGSINYYNKKQEDLLGWVPADPIVSVKDQTLVNVGSMKNTGFEIDLNILAVKTEDFKYKIGFVGATNDNKFTSFSNDTYQGQEYLDMYDMPGPGTPGHAQRLEAGERIGNFYMYKFAGVDQLGNMLVYNKDGEIIQGKEAKEEDKRVVGNGLPEFTMSMNHSFQYKEFDLGIFFRGAFGYDLFNTHEFYYGLQSSPINENVLTTAYTDNVKIKGDKILSDYFIEKGDFLKLDAITFGYTLNLEKTYLNSVRFYATGKNLGTLTSFSGVDPELYPINGLTPGITGKGYYPSSFQMIFGVQVKF